MAGVRKTRLELFLEFAAPFRTGGEPGNQDFQDLGASFFHLLEDTADMLAVDEATRALWRSYYNDTDLPVLNDGRIQLTGLLNLLLTEYQNTGLTPGSVVLKAGDTMTGPLVVPAAAAGNQAMNRDTADLRYLPGLGGTTNLILNGEFFVNERGYVSGTATTVANQYTFDRWRVVISGQSVSAASSGRGNIVTAPAGGLEQVIDGANVQGGVYRLQWTGTAVATVNGAAVLNNAEVTLGAGANATVRFSGGTVSNVQLQPSALQNRSAERHADLERLLCMPYCEKVGGGSQIVAYWYGYQAVSQPFGASVNFKVRKRITPSVMLAGAFNLSNGNTATISNASPTGFVITANATAAGTNGIWLQGAGNYIIADAEL